MFPGYTEYLVPICHLLKEQAETDEEKAQFKQVLTDHVKFANPCDLLVNY